MVQDEIFVKELGLRDNGMVQERAIIKETGLWTISNKNNNIMVYYVLSVCHMYYLALTALLSAIVIKFSALFDISCVMIFALFQIVLILVSALFSLTSGPFLPLHSFISLSLLYSNMIVLSSFLQVFKIFSPAFNFVVANCIENSPLEDLLQD